MSSAAGWRLDRGGGDGGGGGDDEDSVPGSQ